MKKVLSAQQTSSSTQDSALSTQHLFTHSGQAALEMVFLVPLFVILIGGAMSAVYVGWQSLKVQEAANMGARIQGQERVGGGKDFDSIQAVNGQDEAGERVYDNMGDPRSQAPQKPSVYRRVYFSVKSFFSKMEQEAVFIPKPIVGQNVDEVQVHRFLKLPDIPFLNRRGVDRVKLSGRAWGGEDTYMYGLPRWGKTGSSSDLGGNSGSGEYEWQRLLQGTKTSSDE